MDAQTPPEPVAPRKPGLHRRLYDWTLSLAGRPNATWALAFISFSESIWFPLPPDILQIPLTLGKPRRAMWYALVNSASNVAGGVAGYAVGYFLRSMVAGFFGEHAFDALAPYTSNLWLLTAGALVVHPYKIFTIGAGFLGVDLFTYTLASIIGRAPRFFIIGALLYYFGETAKRLIDKYFNLLTILLGLAIAAAIAGMVFFKPKHDPSHEPTATPAGSSTTPAAAASK